MNVDMIGYETGLLKVISYAGKKGSKSLWLCECKCGNECTHTTAELRVHKPQSCGCIQREIAKGLAPLAGKKRTFKNGSCANSFDSKKSAANTSGIKGVSYYKKTGKWRAQIRYAGKSYHLGLYEDINDAAEVRKEAENYIKKNFESLEKIEQYFYERKKE